MSYLGKVLDFWQDESGATAVEYGLILAFVFLALVGGATNLSESLDSMYSSISGDVDASVNASLGQN